MIDIRYPEEVKRDYSESLLMRFLIPKAPAASNARPNMILPALAGGMIPTMSKIPPANSSMKHNGLDMGDLL